jgi:hypothetical protein
MSFVPITPGLMYMLRAAGMIWIPHRQHGCTERAQRAIHIRRASVMRITGSGSLWLSGHASCGIDAPRNKSGRSTPPHPASRLSPMGIFELLGDPIRCLHDSTAVAERLETSGELRYRTRFDPKGIAPFTQQILVHNLKTLTQTIPRHWC